MPKGRFKQPKLPLSVRDDNIKHYLRQEAEPVAPRVIDKRALQPDDLNNPFGKSPSVRKSSIKRRK